MSTRILCTIFVKHTNTKSFQIAFKASAYELMFLLLCVSRKHAIRLINVLPHGIMWPCPWRITSALSKHSARNSLSRIATCLSFSALPSKMCSEGTCSFCRNNVQILKCKCICTVTVEHRMGHTLHNSFWCSTTWDENPELNIANLKSTPFGSWDTSLSAQRAETIAEPCKAWQDWLRKTYIRDKFANTYLRVLHTIRWDSKLPQYIYYLREAHDSIKWPLC